jgi:hypothetical protein
MEASVALNGGRSCVNASTIALPSHARDVAEALAERLARLDPREPEDPGACLAAFLNKGFAEAIDARLDELLEIPGAEDLTREARGGKHRRVESGGLTYLLPTLVFCSDPEHPLARNEFMFPFASVVEVPQETMCEWIGPSLVVSGITDDPHFRRELLRCRSIDRLNLGVIATPVVQWNQPHEGNLFEWLYRRRAIQVADGKEM